MLEECGLPYEVRPVDINAGEQFRPEFLAISPNNRIPAIVDRAPEAGEALPVFESGAILVYLAEKTGRLLPPAGAGRYAVLQWLAFQVGRLGPICGQAHHFRQKMGGVDVPYAADRYTAEVGRLYGAMDRRLAEAPCLGGDDCSIADVACWPWVRPHRRQGQALDAFPHLASWFDRIGRRPAVGRGMALLQDRRGRRDLSDRARELLFGEARRRRR